MKLAKAESAVWNNIVDMIDSRACQRDCEAEKILSRRDIYAAQKWMVRARKKIRQLIPLDFGRCELTPETSNVIYKDGYRIENITIQSLPGHYVPVNVYVPAEPKSEKMPAIIVPMGHWPEGKRFSANQILCANFARKGIIAATYDPPCQGERDMFPEMQEDKLGDDMWAVTQHLIPGIQCYLLGENLQSYFVWDGIRVIDYLCGRQDVDADRIGCTGQSGGGTQTQYLTVLDSRISVASPIQSVTKQAWTMRCHGVGDAEQSPIGRDKDFALDLADNFWAAFPKPVMLNIGLRDTFDLRGLRHVEAEIGSLYNLFGHGGKFAVYDDDCEHVITERIRKNAYRWFTKWFFCHEDETEYQVEILEKDELCCLRKSTKTTVDMVYEQMEKMWPKKRATAEKICSFISAEADGYTILPLEENNGEEVFMLYTLSHQAAYCKLRRGSGRNLRLILDFLPEAHRKPTVSGGEWALEIMPFGYHDTVSKKTFGYDDESNNAIAYFLAGKSLLSDRVSQILTALDFVAEMSGGFDRVTVDARGQGGILGIIASLYDKRITAIKAEAMPACYKQYFGIRDYLLEESAIAPGIMRLADIPGIAALAEIPIELVSAVGSAREPLSHESLSEIYKNAANVVIRK